MIRDLLIAFFACAALLMGFGQPASPAELLRALAILFSVLLAIAVIAVAGSVVRRSPDKGGFR